MVCGKWHALLFKFDQSHGNPLNDVLEGGKNKSHASV
jgi:hypothetical protein